MAEENKVVEEKKVLPTGESPDNDNTDNSGLERPSDKISALEEQALAMGWRSKEHWEGDPDEFVDAKEFVQRQKFYDRIETQSKKIKDLEKSLNMLSEHHKKVYETSYKKALEDLKAERLDALEAGEYRKAAEIEDRIDEVKREAEVTKTVATTPKSEPDPGFVRWVSANQWYVTDLTLRNEADRIGIAYAAIYKDKPADEIVEYVAKEIRRLHPEKFRNPNKDRASVVEGSSSKNKPTKSVDIDLTEEEERAMKTFIRQGIMTKDDYMKEIKRVKGL